MGSFFSFLLPSIMLSVGAWLVGKDTNKTGADDAVGSILVAASPAVSAAVDGNNSAKVIRKSMIAVRDAASAWLDQNPE